DLAANGELTFEEIPTVKTIKGWIGRYSANFKKDASEKAISKNNSDGIKFSEGSSKRQKCDVEHN
ncbi:4163_t:CDS:1, partial [Racocetra fulgida]